MIHLECRNFAANEPNLKLQPYLPYLPQILQSLSVQGLASSGGGSTVSADGGNSSGVSRAIVKDRCF